MVAGKALVICSRSGEPISVAQTSDKGFKKSTEQGALWVLDPGTGRLLPLDGAARLIEIVDRGSFYRAIVDAEDRGAETAGDQAETAPAGAATSRSDQPPASAAHRTGRESGDATAPEVGTASQDLLLELQAVIAERRRAMPEGSYTTHLFREGIDKIRKKTGEEAVELILARRDDEIVSEGADLIYHLLVLLQASGLGIEAVLQQLAKRMQ